MKHSRFDYMRVAAKRHGKAVPTLEQLENMLTRTNGMVCKDCGRTMNWLRTDRDSISTQITLQHYRSGSMALVCLACNTKHAKMPGDTYLALPKGHKRCPMCAQIKPLAEFGMWRSRGVTRPHSKCHPCRLAYQAESQRRYRQKNKERQP